MPSYFRKCLIIFFSSFFLYSWVLFHLKPTPRGLARTWSQAHICLGQPMCVCVRVWSHFIKKKILSNLLKKGKINLLTILIILTLTIGCMSTRSYISPPVLPQQSSFSVENVNSKIIFHKITKRAVEALLSVELLMALLASLSFISNSSVCTAFSLSIQLNYNIIPWLIFSWLHCGNSV